MMTSCLSRCRIAELEEAESKLQESLAEQSKEKDEVTFVVKQREEEATASQAAIARLAEELR